MADAKQTPGATPFIFGPGERGYVPLDEISLHSPQQTGVNRRSFLVLTGFSGLAIGLSSCGQPLTPQPSGEVENSAPGIDAEINQYVHINTNGKITLFTPHPEVGQGVRTSLPMILAEELDADWSAVSVKSAAIDASKYGLQYAGGSTSVLRRFPELRRLAAAARSMLISAASETLGAGVSELTTEKSFVIHKASNRRLSYAELAEAASNQTPPLDAELNFKDPNTYKFLGKRFTSVDNETIVRGQSIFGIDIQLPGMLYAAFVKCPNLGGRVKSANLDEVKALPGVVDAFIIDGTGGVPYYDATSDHVASGVAIVAKSTWQSFKARDALKVEWDLSDASTDDSDVIAAQAAQLAAEGAGEPLEDIGDVDSAFASADKVIDSYYTCDFLSHAQLEPENCVAHYKDEAIEVWAPSQTPTGTVVGLMKVLGFAPKDTDPQQILGMALQSGKVKVHQIRGGGGFGRRLENDYAREVALIAKRVDAPVKLQWKREDDMAFDYYRAPLFNKLTAGLDGTGKLTAWQMTHVSVSADGETSNRDATPAPSSLPKLGVPNYRVINPFVPSKTPTGPMRAPGSNVFAFSEQSFIHELAIAAGRDHIQFIIELLGERRWTTEGDPNTINTGRAIDVIEKVAENARWGEQKPAGSALGFAFFFSHAGHVAEIADVSVDNNKNVQINEVWVVADIGPVINMSGAEGQVEGSVIDGISTMAEQKLTIKNGAIQESNYDQYPLLRIDQRPKINTEFIQSDFVPSGIGEPALPPLAPAVCNAIFSATGERIRTLPIINAGFRI